MTSFSSVATTHASASDRRLRLLVVDDSAVMRAIIARAVDDDERFVVHGAVPSIDLALGLLADARVDIILLDLALPGVDGLTALPGLLDAGQGAKVVVVSASVGEGATAARQAMAMGAAATIAKPSHSQSAHRFGEALLARLADLPPPSAPPRMESVGDAFDVVAIGASTGGMHALSRLLRLFPPAFQTPILVTQHLPVSFMPYFAAQLAVLAGRPCEVASDRLRISPGRMIVAPGDAHLRCVDLGDGTGAIRLSHDRAISGCMPSVDPMFASLAQVYGPRVLAIVLSGMGRDGAEGARAIHDAGGCVVVQDQASSVVWGMPGAVVATGLAHAILSPEAIGELAAARRRPHAA